MDTCDRMKASSTRNHIGKLTMAIPLENLSQQCSAAGTYPYISDSSDLEFSSGGANSIESAPATAAMFRNHPFVVTTSSITTTTTNSSSMSSVIMMGNPPPPPRVQESTSSAPPPMVASSSSALFQKRSSMETMREMIFRIAMMQPIHIDPESVKPPRRKNVKISKDPQSVAARHRRERISERIRILQRLVPGGTKMDTASMLDEAAHYLKFLKKQVQSLEQQAAANSSSTSTRAPLINSCIPMTMATAAAMNYSNLIKSCFQTPRPPPPPHMMMGSLQMLS